MAQGHVLGSHSCQRGETPSLRTHSGAETEESEGPRGSALPTLAQTPESVLFCSVSRAGPSLDSPSAPWPSFQQDLALPCGSASRQSWHRPLCVLAESPPLGTQEHRHPVIVPGDSYVGAYIRSSVALAGTGAHKGWAANQDGSRGLCGMPSLSQSVPFTLERVT